LFTSLDLHVHRKMSLLHIVYIHVKGLRIEQDGSLITKLVPNQILTFPLL